MPDRILSITEVTLLVKDLIETSFPSVWLTGEISNFARPQSGHCYFTLKDAETQMRAVMWKGTAGRVGFEIADGQQVNCHGRLEVYAPRGTYQIVVDEMQPRGVGALELKLRQLRDKLQREGLFDSARKRPLPPLPRRIGFVTSPTGAAIRDFLEVLRRRFPGIELLVIPARVQGVGAAEEIAAGIATAGRLRPPLDVLVIGRGGGSLEDLWSFNEEVVVRAIVASPIPVVSAVGHEIDVTLSDLAADIRALTPSEAAERVAPSRDDVAATLRTDARRLRLALGRRTETARARLDALAARPVLRRPHDRLHDLARRLDELGLRAARAARQRTARVRQRLDGSAGKLESLSPLAVLARGYSVTQRADGSLVRGAGDVAVGERLVTRLQQGQVTSLVEQVEGGAE